MKLVLNMALIQTVIVVSDIVTEKIVKVVNEDLYTSTDYVDHIFSAKVVGSTSSIKKGCKGLIIQSGENNDVCYYLGNIDEEEVTKPKNGPIAKNVGNNVSFAMDDKKLDLQTGGVKINTKDDFYSISMSKNNELISNITSTSNSINTYHKKRILTESDDVIYRVGKGNFIITGYTDKEASENANETEKYKSFNQFYVKSRNMNFDAEGGTIGLSGNVFKTRLGSASLSSFIPGEGATKSFDVEILDGHAEFTIGLGSFYINVENFKFLDEINFRVGSPFHPTASGQIMTAFKNKMYLNTLFPAVSSYIEMKTGATIKMFSTNKIDIESALGDITINSMVTNVNIQSTMKNNFESLLDTNIKSKTMNVNIQSLLDTNIKATKNFKVSSANTAIEALVEAVVKSKMMKLKAEMQMELKSQMIKISADTALDLSASKMIKTGPKSVAPTGSGSWCALPACIFSGAPHSGDTAM
jgi:predicted transcriptional regulator